MGSVDAKNLSNSPGLRHYGTEQQQRGLEKRERERGRHGVGMNDDGTRARANKGREHMKLGSVKWILMCFCPNDRSLHAPTDNRFG